MVSEAVRTSVSTRLSGLTPVLYPGELMSSRAFPFGFGHVAGS